MILEGSKKIKVFKNKFAVGGEFTLADVKNALRRFEKAKYG